MSADTPQAPTVLGRAREVARLRHLSMSTEDSYVLTIRRFIRFHHGRHPREMGVDEIRSFLSHLAIDRNVAASTQNAALAGLLFLYRDVLQLQLPNIDAVERARRPIHRPAVLTRSQVRAVLDRMEGEPALVAALLYGAGLRLMEGLRLRVKDIDLDRHQLTVRDTTGLEDRVSMLPQLLVSPIRHQLARARRVFEDDQSRGIGVSLLSALDRKDPHAPFEWSWRF